MPDSRLLLPINKLPVFVSKSQESGINCHELQLVI